MQSTTIVQPTFVDQEVPGGAIDGVNGVFTLANNPSPDSSLYVWLNGLLKTVDVHYVLTTQTVDGQTTTLINFYADQKPQPRQVLAASYRY
jgi:hypothetical protein